MSGAHDLRLIVQYFGRSVAANAAAAMKGPKPASALEAVGAASGATEMLRPKSAHSLPQMLVDAGHQPRAMGAAHSRSMSTSAAPTTIAKDEGLSKFDLLRFGPQMHSTAATARARAQN